MLTVPSPTLPGNGERPRCVPPAVLARNRRRARSKGNHDLHLILAALTDLQDRAAAYLDGHPPGCRCYTCRAFDASELGDADVIRDEMIGVVWFTNHVRASVSSLVVPDRYEES